MTKARLFLFLLTAAALGSNFLGTAAAQRFPRFEEENLSGQQVALPDAASGKVAVLVLGFTHASKTPTEAWAKRIQREFGNSAGFGLYQLPVLEDVPRLVRGMVVAGIRNGVPDNQRATFIPVLHHEDQLKKLVGYDEKAEDNAYIVVLDRGGRVVYQTRGDGNAAGYGDLRARLQALLK
jgi:hypothetical protein